MASSSTSAEFSLARASSSRQEEDEEVDEEDYDVFLAESVSCLEMNSP